MTDTAKPTITEQPVRSLGAFLPAHVLTPTLRALLVVISLLGAAIVQLQLVHGHDTLVQLVWFVASAGLFALAVPEDALPRAPWLASRTREEVERYSVRLDSFNLGAAGAIFLVALILFWENRDRNLAFGLWWLVMLFYVCIFGPKRFHFATWPARLWGMLRTPAGAAGTGIVLLVAFVTFFRLATIPYGLWWDEANFALYAQEILHHTVDFPFLAPFGDPSLEFYIHALEQLIFGPTQLATRVFTGICGVATVALLGFLAAIIWNRGFALVAMAALGFMRWHINFSRFGIHEMVFEFFMMGVLVSLFLGLRGRRPVWFALAGVLLGLSMHIYTPSDALVGLVALVSLYGLIVLRPRLQPTLVAILAVGFLLAYLPLLEAGIQNPVLFNGRAKQVSIFSSANAEPPLQALEHNLQAHALMFNVNGDHNGRHNIPGSPQLDLAGAVLFVLGLIWLLVRVRRPLHVFLILWFLAMMAPAVFSLDFEAPQSARAASAQVPVAIFIALALWGAATVVTRAVLARNIRRLSQPMLAAGLLTAVLVLMAASNVGAYFDAEEHNEGVWESWATDATFVGRELATLPPGEMWYISPQLAFHPTVQYLAPGRGPGTPLDPALDLPFRGSGPVAVFLARNDAFAYPLLTAYYPHADFRLLRGPDPLAPPLAYEARLSSADIGSIQGLNFTYRSGGQTIRLHTADLTLPPRLHAPSGSVTWSGGIQIAGYSAATLSLTAPGRITVLLDRRPVCSGVGSIRCTRVWVRGNHALTVRVDGMHGATPVSWRWTGSERPAFFDAPLTGDGLTASYYPDSSWTGKPFIVQREPRVDYYYQTLPLARPFTVRWTGQMWAPRSGWYIFGLDSIDDSWLDIDGKEILHTAPGATSIPTELTRGWHRVEVRLLAVDNFTHIYLSWTPPGFVPQPGQSLLQPIPSENFRP